MEHVGQRLTGPHEKVRRRRRTPDVASSVLRPGGRCLNIHSISCGSDALLVSVAHFVLFPSLRSHGETADHIEAIASRAAAASERTWALLTDLLQDNSTEEYIRKLTEQ